MTYSERPRYPQNHGQNGVGPASSCVSKSAKVVLVGRALTPASTAPFHTPRFPREDTKAPGLWGYRGVHFAGRTGRRLRHVSVTTVGHMPALEFQSSRQHQQL